jgi:hypothetical protein
MTWPDPMRPLKYGPLYMAVGGLLPAIPLWIQGNPKWYHGVAITTAIAFVFFVAENVAFRHRKGRH